MTLDDDAVQADHGRAIVASRVQARAQSVERGLCRQRAQFACEVARELRAQRVGDQLGGAFHRLERNVAGETVRHDHVHLVRENIMPLDETHVVEPARAQQVVRGLHDLVALDLLFADVEQTHARSIVGALQIGGQDGSHDAELQQLFRRRRRIGAEIEHVGMPAARWNQRPDRRALDARQHLEHEMRHCHQCAGVAGADASVRVAGLDQIKSAAHRGILLAPQGFTGMIGHFNDLRGEDAGEVRRRAAVRRLALEIRLAADQCEPHTREFMGCRQRRRNARRRASIAAHGVDGNMKQLSHYARAERAGRRAARRSGVRAYSSPSPAAMSALVCSTLRPR